MHLHIEMSCQCVIWADSAFPMRMSGKWAECTLIDGASHGAVSDESETWALQGGVAENSVSASL